ncbi:hypothetical protein D3C80_2086320 [compost metagenome]
MNKCYKFLPAHGTSHTSLLMIQQSICGLCIYIKGVRNRIFVKNIESARQILLGKLQTFKPCGILKRQPLDLIKAQ